MVRSSLKKSPKTTWQPTSLNGRECWTNLKTGNGKTESFEMTEKTDSENFSGTKQFGAVELGLRMREFRQSEVSPCCYFSIMMTDLEF